MSHELSNAEKLVSEGAFIERTREIFQKLQAIDPTKIRCMMGIVVTDSPEDKDNIAANVFVLGNDGDIAKMITTMVTATHEGIAQANASPTPNEEVKH